MYNNATISKKANIYFDGNVSSRSIETADGEKKTLGIMLPGDYLFNTAAAEIMELLAGNCAVKLNGESTWNTYTAGQRFEVPANSSFDIKVSQALDYICHFA